MRSEVDAVRKERHDLPTNIGPCNHTIARSVASRETQDKFIDCKKSHCCKVTRSMIYT